MIVVNNDMNCMETWHSAACRKFCNCQMC